MEQHSGIECPIYQSFNMELNKSTAVSEVVDLEIASLVEHAMRILGPIPQQHLRRQHVCLPCPASKGKVLTYIGGFHRLQTPALQSTRVPLLQPQTPAMQSTQFTRPPLHPISANQLVSNSAHGMRSSKQPGRDTPFLIRPARAQPTPFR